MNCHILWRYLFDEKKSSSHLINYMYFMTVLQYFSIVTHFQIQFLKEYLGHPFVYVSRNIALINNILFYNKSSKSLEKKIFLKSRLLDKCFTFWNAFPKFFLSISKKINLSLSEIIFLGKDYTAFFSMEPCCLETSNCFLKL